MSFAWLNKNARAEVVGYFVERFGMEEADFDGLELYDKGEFVNAVAREVRPFAEELDGEDAGVTLARRSKTGSLKPTTRGVQAYCKNATKYVVEISRADLRSLVEGRTVELPDMKGFVILRLEGEIAGVGLAREGRLLNQLPRNFTQHLVFS